MCALHYPDAFNPQVIGLSPLGNNAAEGVTADVILLVRINNIPRELKVSAISNASPVVLTAPDHGLSNGDIIIFSYVPGMYQLIGNSYSIQDVSTNSFALYVAADGIDQYTVLMLHQDGVNGSTVFTDSETQGTSKVMTANGDVKLSTSQYEFGGASGLYDGNGDYLTTPDSNDFYFGTGNFTVDFWVRFNDHTGAQSFVSQYLNNSNRWTVLKNSLNDKLVISCTYLGVVQALYTMTNTWSVQNNQWYHLTFERSGSTALIFIDGVSQALTASTSFNTNDIGDIGASLYVGQNGNSAGYVNGWMDEIRISKGIARWVSNFIHPTQAYSPIIPIDGTSFALFTEYSVSDTGVSYSKTRDVPLVVDPVTGTYSAKLSKVNQEERLEGIEIALITQADQSFLARAGYTQT